MSRINMRQIEIFDAVMRFGGFTAASEQLNVSTPNVSKTISLLEYRLGCSLFNRTGRGVRPTQAALSLHERAKAISGWVSSLNVYAESLRSTTSVRLRIVSTPAPGIELIPIVISQICSRFPGAQLTFECMPAEMLAGHLDAGHADLAVSLFGPSSDDFHVQTLGHVPLWSVFRNLASLAGKTQVDPPDLLGNPLVAYLPGTPLDDTIRDWFDKAGLVPNPSVLVSNCATACSVVGQQSAVALVDGLTVRSAMVSGLHTLPISPPILVPVVMARRRDAVSSALTITFERMLMALMDSWFDDPMRPESVKADSDCEPIQGWPMNDEVNAHPA